MTATTKKPAAKKAATKKTASKKAAVKKTVAKKAAAKPAAKKVSKTEGKKPRAPGIGSLIKELILKNKETEAILEAVLAKFPEAATTANNVSWYRTKLRSDSLLK